MKKLLLTIFLMSAISIQAFGAITAPYFGIFTGIQGLSYIPSSGYAKGGSDFGIISGIDVMLGKRVYFYGQGYFFMPNSFLTSSSQKDFSVLSFNYGLGVGYRIFDDRVDGKGNSFNINLTASIRSMRYPPNVLDIDYNDGTNIYTQSSIASYFGGEIFANYYYSVFKNFTLRAGLNFGAFATMWTDKRKYTKPVNINDPEFKTSFEGISITYGLSIGLAF